MTVITKPGLYEGLANDVYHAQTGWWSSSQLKALLPEQYRPGGSTDALSFGSLFHTVVLEPDLVGSLYVALDPETVGVKADGAPAANPTSTVAWRRAVAEVEAAGKQVVSRADLDRAWAMRRAVQDHDTARRLLLSGPGVNEQSAFAVDADGIRHKARFDRHSPGRVVDLKSTAAMPGAHSLTSTVVRYGYETSAAHYLEVADLLGLDVTDYALIFVSKEPPHRVTVCGLDDLFFDRGRMLRAQALDRATGVGDPYEGATGRLTLSCPVWAFPIDDEIEVA